MVRSSFFQTHRVFVVVLTLGLFTMAVRNMTDPDVWWHLRTGQLSLQEHKIFHADPFSYSKFGQPWVDHEWLSQILMFSLYRVTGWGGLMIGFAGVIAGAFLILFLRCPGRPYVAGVFTAWGALATIPCWGVRPQMFTLLFASILLFILERSYSRPKLLWWTPFLMLLWVNLHAGYAIGIAFLAMFLLGDAFDRTLGWEDAPRPGRLLPLTWALVACIAIVPLNPYGIQMYSYPLQTLHSRAMQAYIGEWLSPDFHQSRYLAALLMMLASLLLPTVSPRHLRARELLLLIVATYMALRSVRHLPIYVMVAVPLLSGMVQSILEASPKAGLLTPAWRPLPKPQVILNMLLLAGMVAFTAVRLHIVIGHQAATEAREFPAAAANFLSAHHPPGRLLNHYNWGGYFIWKLYPEYPVFIDGRADLYGDSFLDGFAATYYLRGKFQQDALRTWGIRTVVLPPDAPLVVALKTLPDWKTVFTDQQSVVMVRSK